MASRLRQDTARIVAGTPGAFHLDVGLSSSAQIAEFWGIAADRPAMAR